MRYYRTATNCRRWDTRGSRVQTLKRYASAGSAAGAFSWWIAVAVVLIAWATCALVEARSAAAQDVPTATIEFTGGSIAAGIGYTWGYGALVFEGKEYPLKVDGLTILHVGASGYTGSGAVYHLMNLTDIAGVYTAVSAGAAVAGGATATTMKNDHGVVIEMVATHTGLNLQLGPHGVTISLRSLVGTTPKR